MMHSNMKPLIMMHPYYETSNQETPNHETSYYETPNHETPNLETPNLEAPNLETPNQKVYGKITCTLPENILNLP